MFISVPVNRVAHLLQSNQQNCQINTFHWHSLSTSTISTPAARLELVKPSDPFYSTLTCSFFTPASSTSEVATLGKFGAGDAPIKIAKALGAGCAGAVPFSQYLW